MSRRLVATFFLLGSALALSAGCGGGDPEGEASWETHTTRPDDTAGGEQRGDDAAEAE